MGHLASGGTPSCFQGYGIQFFGPKEYYEGEWCDNQRSGWGRMYYQDGNIYEGHWQKDKPDGEGMLRLSECSGSMKLRPNAFRPRPVPERSGPTLPAPPATPHNTSLVGPEKVRFDFQ